MYQTIHLLSIIHFLHIWSGFFYLKNFSAKKSEICGLRSTVSKKLIYAEQFPYMLFSSKMYLLMSNMVLKIIGKKRPLLVLFIMVRRGLRAVAMLYLHISCFTYLWGQYRFSLNYFSNLSLTHFHFPILRLLCT